MIVRSGVMVVNVASRSRTNSNVWCCPKYDILLEVKRVTYREDQDVREFFVSGWDSINRVASNKYLPASPVSHVGQ